MKSVDVRPTDDLQDMENALTTVSACDPGEEIRVHLARRQKMHFFKDSRIAALLATAAQRGVLLVKDWHSEWKPSDAVDYFRGSLASFATATYATGVTNDRDSEPPFTLKEIRNEVGRDGGILEPHNVSAEGYALIGKSLTFCAVDPEFAEPLSLSGLVNEKSKFVSQFIALRDRYLEQKKPAEAGDLFTEVSDQDLAGYLFELYQNSFEHGRFSTSDQIIPGLRFISMRKHVAVNREALLSYASGFPQLAQYVERRCALSKSLRFYEVSVSDQGLGMVRRFLAKRQDFSANVGTRETRLELLKRLLTEPLTSKKGYPGAGYGLERALKAVQALNGFVTLRTDSFWLYGAFPDGQDQAAPLLTEVTPGANPAWIAGTHFNALFPLRLP